MLQPKLHPFCGGEVMVDPPFCYEVSDTRFLFDLPPQRVVLLLSGSGVLRV